jgi:hypothetical protein
VGGVISKGHRPDNLTRNLLYLKEIMKDLLVTLKEYAYSYTKYY